MLTVHTLNGIQAGSQTIQGSVVVVNDHYGNPLVVVQEVNPGVAVVVPANEPGFNRIITGLGLDKTVVCNQLLINNQVPAGAELIAGPGKELLL
jgi:hypothetical protein